MLMESKAYEYKQPNINNLNNEEIEEYDPNRSNSDKESIIISKPKTKFKTPTDYMVQHGVAYICRKGSNDKVPN